MLAILIGVLLIIVKLEAFQHPIRIHKLRTDARYLNRVTLKMENTLDAELRKTLKELEQCHKSFNPLRRWRVPELNIKIYDIKEKLARESKRITVLTNFKNPPIFLTNITRRKLEIWSVAGLILFDTGSTMSFDSSNFDEIKEGETYLLINVVS